MKDLKGKIVVITGGATGIGLSLAKQFGKEGARVVISGRRESRLKEAVEKLNCLDIEAKYFPCDVSKRQEVENLADFAWDTLGSVDVIVNNAGRQMGRMTVMDTPLETFHDIFNVNTLGVVNGISVFGKRFIDQGTPAAIYNVGSEASLFYDTPLCAAYIASIHAVLAITESLREEVPEFIEVGLICPGFVRSEIRKANMEMGMDTDKYAEIVMEQIKNGEFFIVSHAYNIVRINQRHDALVKAFERYAPRYEGDDEFDVFSLMAKYTKKKK